MFFPGGVKPLQECPPVVGTHAFRPPQNTERWGNPYGLVIFPALLVPIQAGILPAPNDAIAFRVLHAGVFAPCLLHRLPDGLKASCPVQVVEVSLPPVNGGTDRQLAPDGCCGLARGLGSGIPRRAVRLARLHVIVGTQHDLPARVPFPRHARHGFKVSGIEGHQHGEARGQAQTCARCVALGNQQRPIFPTVLCRNGEMPARRLAARHKPFLPLPSDELEGLGLAGCVQNGNHKPPPRQPQPEGGNFLACKVGVGIRRGGCGSPELPGKFGGLGVPFGLFLAGGFLGFGNAGFQGFTFGGGHVGIGNAAPCPFFTSTPILPPEGGRSVQKRLVCPVCPLFLAGYAAAVQNPVRLDTVNHKPRFPEPVREVLENVTRHHHHPRRWRS